MTAANLFPASCLVSAANSGCSRGLKSGQSILAGNRRNSACLGSPASLLSVARDPLRAARTIPNQPLTGMALATRNSRLATDHTRSLLANSGGSSERISPLRSQLKLSVMDDSMMNLAQARLGPLARAADCGAQYCATSFHQFQVFASARGPAPRAERRARGGSLQRRAPRVERMRADTSGCIPAETRLEEPQQESRSLATARRLPSSARCGSFWRAGREQQIQPRR